MVYADETFMKEYAKKKEIPSIRKSKVNLRKVSHGVTYIQDDYERVLRVDEEEWHGHAVIESAIKARHNSGDHG